MAYVHKARGTVNRGTMNWQMFPARLEETPILEQADQVRDFHRDTLKDFSIDPISLASDAPRRNYDGNYGKLTLRHTGTRSGLDPENPDLFLDFTDRDYRGHLNEIPWDKYREQSWHRKGVFEYTFKDDSDYSVPSAGVHPHTIYPYIRRAQAWTKARLKVFDTAKGGWQHGGRVEIPHASTVNKYQGSVENLSADLIHQNPEQRSHKTTILSNVFQSGQRSTTDHQFKVAEYGKIYKSTPHMEHQSQTKYVNPDTPLPELTENTQVNKNMVLLMAAATRGSLDPSAPLDSAHITAAAAARHRQQELVGDGVPQYLGGLKSEDALEATIRGRRLTGDILKLLGYVRYEAEFGSARAGPMRKTPDRANIDKIRRFVQLVHEAPANVKLQIANELINKAYHAGANLKPSRDMNKLMREVILNPEVVQFMDMAVRSNKPLSEISIRKNKQNANADSESIYEGIEGLELFVSKGKHPENTAMAKRKGLVAKKASHFDDIEELKTHSYSGVVAKRATDNKKRARTTQKYAQSALTKDYKRRHDPNKIADVRTTRQDMDMAESGHLDRHGGRLGRKYQRRQMASDTIHGELHDLTTTRM